MAAEICPVELVESRRREAVLAQCRAERVEPPGPTRLERILAAGASRAEADFCTATLARLGEVTVGRLLAISAVDNPAGAALLAELKRDPAAVGLDSLLAEIAKLNAVRSLGLPDGLFAGVSDKLVAAWRARAIKMYPSDLRDVSEPARVTLLAALCTSREREITDGLVDLLIGP